MRAFISGTGSYLPEQILTNEDLAARVPGCDPDWVWEKLGIRARRIAAPDEQASDLGVKAARAALDNAGLGPEDLDGIVCVIGTGDVPLPATACYIQAKLGATRAFAFDLKSACAGAIAGTMTARGMVEAQMARHILVVGPQIFSRTTLNWQDRGTAPIFGDGAGAAIVSASETESAFVHSKLQSDGDLTHIVGQYIGGTERWYRPEDIAENRVVLEMDGRAVWDCAVTRLPEIVRALLSEARVTASEVDFVVSHQANRRLLFEIMDRLELPRSKTFTNVERYANTACASALIALDEAHRADCFRRGQTVVFMAIGAGMTWGAHLLRW